MIPWPQVSPKTSFLIWERVGRVQRDDGCRAGQSVTGFDLRRTFQLVVPGQEV